jgi:hypothetical protein
MNRRASFVAMAAGTITLFAMATGAHAATLTAFAIAGGTTQDANVFYTPGTGGGLSVVSTSEFLQGKLGQGFDNNATISFTNMANGSFSLSGSGAFDQLLNPASTSSFVITDNTTHAVLLSGTVGSADLTGHTGASSGNVNLTSNNVTYTGGTFFPSGFSNTNGSLAIEFTSTTPFSATASGLGAFTAVDGITFSGLNERGPGGGGNGVPEPASYASMGLGAAMLLAALLRKKRAGRTLAA